MHIQGIGGELRLALLHRNPSQSPAEPDLQVQCSARTALFSVEASNAWLEWPDVKAFIAELEALDHALTGKAELHAMSPQDFALTIESLDSKGHLGVSFTIGSHNRTGNGQFAVSVSGGFEVLPSEIAAVLMWFKAVVADEGAT